MRKVKIFVSDPARSTRGGAYDVRCDAYNKGDYDNAIQDYSQAVQLKLTGSLYSAIWRYLERELRGENGSAELRHTLPD